MNRALPIAATVVAFVISACGSAATAGSTSSPSPNGAAQFRNGASGLLVQITGQKLILTGPNGDSVVTFSSTTTITKTSTATLADIVAGTCVVANGQKDSTGHVTATTVRVAPKSSAGGCTIFGRGAPSPQPGASPRPTPSGNPNPNAATVAGQVTAASGTSITILTATAGSLTITVPTTAMVTLSSTASAANLQTGECLRATGPKDTAGTIAATSLAITPPGPGGTCATGFPGGGRPGGGQPAAGG